LPAPSECSVALLGIDMPVFVLALLPTEVSLAICACGQRVQHQTSPLTLSGTTKSTSRSSPLSWSSPIWQWLSVLYRTCLRPQSGERAGWRGGQAVIPALLGKPPKPFNQKNKRRVSLGEFTIVYSLDQPDDLSI
jgi:hypothetical protein